MGSSQKISLCPGFKVRGSRPSCRHAVPLQPGLVLALLCAQVDGHAGGVRNSEFGVSGFGFKVDLHHVLCLQQPAVIPAVLYAEGDGREGGLEGTALVVEAVERHLLWGALCISACRSLCLVHQCVTALCLVHQRVPCIVPCA